jgi:dienelactone hydrolase
MRHLLPILTVLALVVAGFAPLSASEQDAPSVLKPGQSLKDSRLKPPKDLNGYFPFLVPETVEGWEQRAEELRRRILVSNDLWPMPPRTEMNPVIHGKVEREGFTVEKVYFEALPGFYVTGMLFRPTEGEGPFPGVLCPHGHGGRTQDVGPDRIRQQIVRGEERFESSGRFAKLARCAQLARMGCVAFIYDMIGYADSNQLSYDLAHRFAKQRPEMEDPESWGFYSTQAELRVQSIMGLQTWSSIRALDFLESLPDVDPERLGVTGGSGGGTQTILLGAIDPRPVVAFPQGMVSTAMQGGCTCENTSLLRIGTGNVELTALFAPRPQAMTTADDWTKEMMTRGFPELQKLYEMLGVPDHVECTPMPHFPHNYNYVTRARMYSWFNKHLDLGLPEPIVEEDWELIGEAAGHGRGSAPESLSVWNDEHPAPSEQGDEFERKLIASMTQQSDQQIHALAPSDSESLAQYREIVGGAVETILGRTIETVGPVQRTDVGKEDRGDHWIFTDLITLPAHEEQLPVVSIHPKGTDWNGRVVLWLTGQGKAGLFDAGQPREEVLQLVRAGNSVVTADLFAQGEFVNDELPSDQNRVVANPREFAGYTYTYNHSLFAQRAHDVLSLIEWIRTDEHEAKEIVLVGTGGIGPVVAAAGAVSGDAVTATAIETAGFRFTQLSDYRDVNFLPGIVKYGDLPALLALNAPRKLLVLGDEEDQAPVTRDVYAAANGSVTWKPSAERAEAAIVEWLVQ